LLRKKLGTFYGALRTRNRILALLLSCFLKSKTHGARMLAVESHFRSFDQGTSL
jgi:hypothetical protein